MLDYHHVDLNFVNLIDQIVLIVYVDVLNVYEPFLQLILIYLFWQCIHLLIVVMFVNLLLNVQFLLHNLVMLILIFHFLLLNCLLLLVVQVYLLPFRIFFLVLRVHYLQLFGVAPLTLLFLLQAIGSFLLMFPIP